MTTLQWFFHYYNRTYFGNRLPTYKVMWSKEALEFKYLGAWDSKRKIIWIAKGISKHGTVVAGTLLHEMAHAAIGRPTHGPKFEKEMLRLAKKGAFRNIW